MANIKSIISMHNKEVITEKKTQAVNCNCINKPNCPLSNQCRITNIIYIQNTNYIKSSKLSWKNVLRNQRRYI